MSQFGLPFTNHNMLCDEPMDHHNDFEDKPRLSASWLESLASIAMSAWALRKKSADLDSGGSKNLLVVHSESIIDALRELGVEVIEYVSQPYVPGLNVDILAFVPDENVDTDTITATVRPAVCFQGRIIQRGQVIVSTTRRKGI